jgi:hypothetical protein
MLVVKSTNIWENKTVNMNGEITQIEAIFAKD